MQYLPLIQQTFPEMSRFVYLAGSPNFLVFENGKTIVLHKENLPHQIQKYHRLKQYFPNFAGTYEIDLGSLLENKVIVME